MEKEKGNLEKEERHLEIHREREVAIRMHREVLIALRDAKRRWNGT